MVPSNCPFLSLKFRLFDSTWAIKAYRDVEMYIHAFLTLTPDKCVWSALYIRLLYARRQRPFYPIWHRDDLNNLKKTKPAPMSGTESRYSDPKARNLVTTVRCPDVGVIILLSLKRPYVSARLHGVNPRRRLFRSPCCHNQNPPSVRIIFVCLCARRVPYIPLAFRASLCTFL